MSKNYLDPQFVANILGKYVAMNENGAWEWYDDKPVKSNGIFYNGKGKQGNLPSEIFSYNGAWKDSLREPNCIVPLVLTPAILAAAEDIKVRVSSKVTCFLRDGYHITGEIFEKNNRFYRTLVKIPSLPQIMSDYMIVPVADASGYLANGFKVFAAPFVRSDGAVYVELYWPTQTGETVVE